MGELLLGAAWTVGALVVAYVAAVIAGLSGSMDFSGLGRMIAAGTVTFVALEILGFYVIGAVT